MFTGIAHVAYNATDMQRALDFYCKGLGFTHAFSIEDDEGKPWIEYLKVADGQFVELFYSNPEKTAAGDRYNHLCLKTDDIEAVAQTLKERGIAILTGPSQGKDHNWQLWVADPDGNRVEIMMIDPTSPQANS